MAKLTEAQKQFLREHGFWKESEKGGKSTLGLRQEAAFKKFFDRRARILEQLERLPENDRKPFEEKLNEAEKQAVTGDFKAAYKTLNRVKRQALSGADEFTDQLRLEDTDRLLGLLLLSTKDLVSSFEKLDSGKQEILEELGRQKKASEFDDWYDSAKYLLDTFSKTEVELQLRVDGLFDLGNQIIEILNEQPKLRETLGEIDFELQRLEKEKSVDVEEQKNRLNTLLERLRIAPNPKAIEEDLKRFEIEFTNRLKQHKDFQQGKRDDIDDKELTEELERRRINRLNEVKLQFKLDRMGDRDKLEKTDDGPVKVYRPREFSTEEMALDLALPSPLELKQDIPKARKLVGEYIDDLLETELTKPNSDIVFDLGLKNKSMFVAELAEALGLVSNPKLRSNLENKLLEEMAEEMVEAVRKRFPNKAGESGVIVGLNGDREVKVDAPLTFTLGDVNYENPKYLASGGYGHVLRYEKKGSPGEYIVIKTMKDPKKRQEMVQELKSHRHANGGEGGKNDPNVLEMKGLVQGTDDKGDVTLFMALEYADGGQMRAFGRSMIGASHSGLLSEEARKILNQHLMRQTISGMKHVQDRNMTHRDLKPENCMIGTDGKPKVCDFGSGQFGDERGEVDERFGGGRTPGYFPDNQPSKVTGKIDTYALGVMLDDLSGHHNGMDRANAELRATNERGRAVRAVQREWTGKESATALDKLKFAMLDEDPNKRPTLETILQSSYLNDGVDNYEPEKIENLMQALMEYNKHVGKQISSHVSKIGFAEYEIFAAERLKLNPKYKTESIEQLDETIEKHRRIVFEETKKMNEILELEENKRYAEALKQANLELIGRDSGRQLDVEKTLFVEQYDDIVKTSELPADTELRSTLTQLDEATDPKQKKKFALQGQERALTLIEQLQNTGEQDTGKKLTASKLAVNLRRLRQALERLIQAIAEQKLKQREKVLN